MSSTAEKRFWQKVDRDGPRGCWLWTASRYPNGYGQFGANWRASPVLAHRFAYELLVGPITTGLQIDHLCRTRHCVNPEHLEPVPMEVNLARGVSPPAINGRKTHCKHGHPFSGENLVMEGHKRRCRACKRAAQRRVYSRPEQRAKRRAYAKAWRQARVARGDAEVTP